MLKPSLLRFLIRLKMRHSLGAPLLTLGVQDILCRYEDAEALLSDEGHPATLVPSAERRLTTSYLYRAARDQYPLIHARTFFRMLGVDDYSDLDASAAEGPTLAHDLNQPIPAEWHGRYQWVLDGGTLEHVFDVRGALSNMVRLTGVGGHVVHINPMNGWANHGFYQISPCVLHDFYTINGFEPVETTLALQMDAGGLRFVAYEYTTERVAVESKSGQSLLIFVARKTADVERIALPTQRKYSARFAPDHKRAG